jgi:hypothetical protein
MFLYVGACNSAGSVPKLHGRSSRWHRGRLRLRIRFERGDADVNRDG